MSKSAIKALISETLRMIDSEPEAAVWRLVDAVGMISEELPVSEDPIIGFTIPTGRGFRVVLEKPSFWKIERKQ